MENNLYSMRRGFKKARMHKGFKQDDVARIMGVTIKTVMNWEQGVSNPDLETTIKLAELFDCDLDYLVGRLDESTHDIHFVSEFTGLSEKAIRRLTPPDKNLNAGYINNLIEADGFQDFMDAYGTFKAVLIRLREAVIPEPKPYPVDQDGNIVIDGSIKRDDGSCTVIGRNTITLPLDKAARYSMQEVSEAIMRLCEPDYKKSCAMCKENSKQTGGMNDGKH